MEISFILRVQVYETPVKLADIGQHKARSINGCEIYLTNYSSRFQESFDGCIEGDGDGVGMAVTAECG